MTKQLLSTRLKALNTRLFSVLLLFLLILPFAVFAENDNALQSISHARIDGNKVQVTLEFAHTPQPLSFTIADPARIAVSLSAQPGVAPASDDRQRRGPCHHPHGPFHGGPDRHRGRARGDLRLPGFPLSPTSHQRRGSPDAAWLRESVRFTSWGPRGGRSR